MNIYQDISQRTQGNIYIGVVGPVRTGKSTFIKGFMEQLVIPNISDTYKRERAVDELPQSAAGRTIMTTEPKFVPDEAVKVTLDNGAALKVRMIDCVGYVVNSAAGHTENGEERMVSTPWNDGDISFVKAAEIGTRKVISEHSTIGLVVTTDGSITDIPRDDYVEAEEKVVNELKQINKPFALLLNCVNPDTEKSLQLKKELEDKYKVPVVTVNCQRLTRTDINNIIENILLEFPVREIKVNFDKWIDILDGEHWLYKSLSSTVKSALSDIDKISSVKLSVNKVADNEYVKECYISDMDMGAGSVSVRISSAENLFYKVLGESSGFEIHGQNDLIKLMNELSVIKKEYDKVSYALEEVARKGYGIVSPTIDELTLEEPEIIKQGGRFGVRLKASAPSIHMIRYKPKFLKTA